MTPTQKRKASRIYGIQGGPRPDGIADAAKAQRIQKHKERMDRKRAARR